MTVGYTDYERISLQGGVLLGSINQLVSGFVFLFEGYAGSLPYITVWWHGNNSTGFYNIDVIYYTDNTFTTEISGQTVSRAGFEVGTTQFPILSPWVIISTHPTSGGGDVAVVMSAFGSTAHSTDWELNRLNGPLLDIDSDSTAAGVTNVHNITHVYGGPTQLLIRPSSVASQLIFYEYWTGSTWLSLLGDFGATNGNTMIVNVGRVDSPKRLRNQNNSGATTTWRLVILAGLSS